MERRAEIVSALIMQEITLMIHAGAAPELDLRSYTLCEVGTVPKGVYVMKKSLLLSLLNGWFDFVQWLLIPLDRLIGCAVRVSGYRKTLLVMIPLQLYQFISILLGAKIALAVICHFQSDTELS
jgi:hypothetical protein